MRGVGTANGGGDFGDCDGHHPGGNGLSAHRQISSAYPHRRIVGRNHKRAWRVSKLLPRRGDRGRDCVLADSIVCAGVFVFAEVWTFKTKEVGIM